jgi:hypothetical protein
LVADGGDATLDVMHPNDVKLSHMLERRCRREFIPIW